MSSIPLAEDVLDADSAVIPISELAGQVGVPVSKLQQMVRDGQLIALRRDREVCVPADFVDESGVVKGLTGTMTVLSDAGFTRSESLRWLFTADESLPGRPIDALRGNRGTEVKRRAQAMAF
ncbi:MULTISPECIES: Rv2175c family DNA-binding protein [Sciscionella]|uniref:Rv2175c family DNA-binding protein n=1 Tax=Sciscionella TaxID=596495 RepID=UPI00036B8271|nr:MULTISPECIES: Rv2175c family DNA-binding protein [Sciscionella]